MPNPLSDNLSGHEDNYILPFIWQHGEEEAVIRQEMERIHASGIRAVCVEARPHPDFLGPRWWHDMDILMDEARRRKMRVWVLDDDHFPTGHANGKLVGAPQELRRLFIKESHIDVLGPQKSASILVQPWLAEGDRLICAVAAHREGSANLLNGDLIDITAGMQGDILYWDLPEGFWRIFLLIATPSGGAKEQMDYFNPLVKESVRVLLDTVYEPFYARYPADFGYTYAGFFSDEPGFYNDHFGYDYQSALGKKGVVYPWSQELLPELEAEFGPDYRLHLPMLWFDGGERTAAVRYTYMNVVSQLYSENLSTQIGDWCRAHQVEYIGHVLEDNGVHARLGVGAAHFFRSMWGQDISGIDVVLWQLAPGFDEGPFSLSWSEADGAFYHYGLAKLGSSLAHVDPKKKGRAMCEVFGAYGWCEGLKLMKWITDHMLAQGINTFVPHAFSQAPFPDPDCPPHLYARGKNPQYRYYHALNHYTNRISHLLSGGVHVASGAVLYHAEAEWSGAAMPFEQPLKALLQSQVDADVIPGDILLGASSLVSKKLQVGAETYDFLVVPTSEALPAALLARLVELAEQGLQLYFIDHLPARSSERGDASQGLLKLSSLPNVQVVALSDLTKTVKAAGFYEVSTTCSQPYLRQYHVHHPNLDGYFFFNEHPYQRVETYVQVLGNGRLLTYDAFENQVHTIPTSSQWGRLQFPVSLSPYESLVVLSGPAVTDLPAGTRPQPGSHIMVIPGPWSVSTATAEQYPAFSPWHLLQELSDLSRPDALPSFSGTFRYETEIEWTTPAGPVFLDLGAAYETSEVWVNGERIGLRIAPPYRFEVSRSLYPGKNTLVVEVTNTLGKEMRDAFSSIAQQEPSGLVGPVKIVY